eukprot:INCI10233.1.p1 GENE.INCI10233.1~~INCI10233.1.p1  ORF type:complete len:778 (+),score=120.21 INCI10233.1:284-2617(+)
MAKNGRGRQRKRGCPSSSTRTRAHKKGTVRARIDSTGSGRTVSAIHHIAGHTSHSMADIMQAMMATNTQQTGTGSTAPSITDSKAKLQSTKTTCNASAAASSEVSPLLAQRRPAAAPGAAASVAPTTDGAAPLGHSSPLVPAFEAARLQAVRKLCSYFATTFAPLLGDGSHTSNAVQKSSQRSDSKRGASSKSNRASGGGNKLDAKGTMGGRGQGNNSRSSKWHTHFEAWMWDQRARVPTSERATQDPIIPTGPSTLYAPELELKLRKAGVSRRVSRDLCQSLSKQAASVRASLERSQHHVSQSRSAYKVHAHRLIIKRKAKNKSKVAKHSSEIPARQKNAADAAEDEAGTSVHAGLSKRQTGVERDDSTSAGSSNATNISVCADSDICTLFVSGLPDVRGTALKEVIEALKSFCNRLRGFTAFSEHMDARFPFVFVKFASRDDASAAMEQLGRLRASTSASPSSTSPATRSLQVQFAKRDLKTSTTSSTTIRTVTDDQFQAELLMEQGECASTNSIKWVLVCQGVKVEINDRHYQSMLQRFKLTNFDTKRDPDEAWSATNATTPCSPRLLRQFHKALFCCLARYSALQGGHPRGGGCQAALFHECFEVLRTDFGVTAECFASPLNAFPGYRTFCSAFADTDAPFGSMGSFFDFQPASGSFEANPPFQPEVVSLMTAHMTNLLQQTQEPLSFVVIIPYWPDKQCWQQLASNRYCRKAIQIDSSDHGYFEGAQHSKTNQHRTSNAASSLFWLQSDEGAKKWPSADNKIHRLLEAFKPK